jgi:serine/threonine-protein kinase
MDFGIAHVEYSTLTQDGAVLGTPRDMSPEQIRGDKVDGLSDIFSLGVIVDEMAAGNRPFLGELLATISSRILSQMPYGRSRFWHPNSIPNVIDNRAGRRCRLARYRGRLSVRHQLTRWMSKLGLKR